MIMLCAACLILLSACHENEIVSLPSAQIFRNWSEVEPPETIQLEGSTFTALNLEENLTYQMSYKSWSDVLYHGDPCNNIPNYYTKGSFTITADSIFFNGCCSDSIHATCLMRCDGVIDYVDGCEYKLTPDSLILNPRRDAFTRRVLLPR